jgi:hypothetical protein
MADTAWNGPLRASAEDWEIYLADRKAKGFTAIQFIGAAPWAGCYTDAEGQTAFKKTLTSLEPNEHFFSRMEERVAAINRHGLLAVVVLAWAANFGESGKHNPGVSLHRGMLEQWVGYQVDRYGKHHVMWLLGGDGKYSGWGARKWKRLGRKIFGDGKHGVVGMHPQGGTWPYGAFAKEDWLNVAGYQSSHADDGPTLKFLTMGPAAKQWQSVKKPIVNLEPCYEGIHDWGGRGVISREQVRRAMYASLFNAPTAGVSYGAHGVWSWEPREAEPLNHLGTGLAMSWRKALELPGSGDVRWMRRLFDSLAWWKLRPVPEVLKIQPGRRDPRRFVSSAMTERTNVALMYLPFGGMVRVNGDPISSQWYDPRTGEQRKAVGEKDTYVAPTAEDWVLICHRG